MLTIAGQKYRLCDGVSRRAFLQIGGLAVGGLSLADLLRAESAGSERRAHKSVIMIFLPGGPSHVDLIDLKPNAPAEIRGEFRPIATRVPGIEICEHLPNLARVLDKVALIRSINGAVDDHACHMCFTGHPRLGPQPGGGWPNFGSVVSRLRGPTDPRVPPFIGLAAPMIHPPYNDPGPGFAGASHAAFTPHGEGYADTVLNRIVRGRLDDRRSLLAGFERLCRTLDRGAFDNIDAFQRQALEMIASPAVRDALDLSQEDPTTRALYGPGDPGLVSGFNAAPRLTEQLLLARRLVEAGARCVTLAFGAWDWHDRNFIGLRQQLPLFDRGLAALATDLHQRGLDKDVAVVAWGEFGRSPRINAGAGRDHWPLVSCAFLTGGGMRVGQVIGATNRLGEIPQERPVHFQEVLATLYRHLGIDIATAQLRDLSGRPQYLTDAHRPIPELQ
ncbi:MAG TPA: DUF1501 domain-containing protein [Planctomycetaceae bacterium]|nr:DUF1501 domain-containing protein [Planctomycetaceae bacterium]